MPVGCRLTSANPIPSCRGLSKASYTARNTRPRKKWGAFGYIGLSDGNPNPFRWAGSIGLAGANPSRPQDNFGVGFFYLGFSGAFKDVFNLLHVRDEFGGELFYNWQATRGFKLSADIQIINPFVSGADTAVVVGIRGKLTF